MSLFCLPCTVGWRVVNENKQEVSDAAIPKED